MAEAIVAMFVLLGGFAVLFRLFHTAVHYSNIVDSRQNKVRIALNKLEEVRAWSQSQLEPVGSLPFTGNWVYWNDAQGVDDENGEIHWKVEVEDHTLYSPCESFELVRPVNERRSMERSCKQVIVRVSDSGIGVAGQPVVLTTLIGQPSAPPTSPSLQVEVNGPTADLGPDAEEGPYTATLSLAGKEILDVFFFWDTLGDAAGSVNPVAGSGTTNQVKIQHKIKVPNGSDMYSVPGSFVPKATCKYRGWTFVNADGPSILVHGP